MPSKEGKSELWGIVSKFSEPLPPLAISDIQNWNALASLGTPPSYLNLGHSGEISLELGSFQHFVS